MNLKPWFIILPFLSLVGLRFLYLNCREGAMVLSVVVVSSLPPHVMITAILQMMNITHTKLKFKKKLERGRNVNI